MSGLDGGAASVVSPRQRGRACLDAGIRRRDREREADCELGPLPQTLAVNIDAAPVQLHEALAERQADPPEDDHPTARDVQHLVVDGVTYSHVVDPRTGAALTNRVVTVVVGARGMVTDALSTAGSILDEAEWRRVLEQTDPAAKGWRFVE